MSAPYHNPNIWRQKRSLIDLDDYYIPRNSISHFQLFPFNESVDIDTKENALRVSPSLVSLISYSGDEPVFWGSGFCIESYNTNNIHFSSLLTSASLLCLKNNTLPREFKVEVILQNGSMCHGEVITFDRHFNVAIIRIQLHVSLPSANLKCVDDSIQAVQSELDIVPDSNLFKLVPGNPLFALGRFHRSPYNLMAAPGIFSVGRCDLDCGELLRLTGKITKCGIGGPIVNPYGEVVGISFYAENFVPFLPINMVCKWWEDFNSSRFYPKPWLGMQVNHLLSARVKKLEQILLKFPDISKAIIVEKVTQDSPTSLAGIRCGDVIVEFAGVNVGSSMELLQIAWDKAGKRADLTVLRSRDSARLNISMVVGDLSTEQYNRWPVPEESSTSIFLSS